MIAEDRKVEVWAIPAPKGGSRAFCDRMNGWAQAQGQPGLGYIFWREGEEGGAGPIARNIGAERSEAIAASSGSESGTRCSSSPASRRSSTNSPARRATGWRASSISSIKNRFEFCWIVDFPMYEWNEEEKKIDFSHNPFSMPQGGLDALQTAWTRSTSSPSSTTSSATASSCRPAPSATTGPMSCAGPSRSPAIAEEVLKEKFGGMYRALHFGAPPHGGIAPGIDRIVMMLCAETNLREVTMFPMNQQAEDLLMGAPGEVSSRQLRELHIRLNLPDSR